MQLALADTEVSRHRGHPRTWSTKLSCGCLYQGVSLDLAIGDSRRQQLQPLPRPCLCESVVQPDGVRPQQRFSVNQLIADLRRRAAEERTAGSCSQADAGRTASTLQLHQRGPVSAPAMTSLDSESQIRSRKPSGTTSWTWSDGGRWSQTQTTCDA